jgi:hypothetical protein
MTNEELEKKAGDWTKRIEDVVIEMASVTTTDGLLVYFTHEKIVAAFRESLAALVNNHANGQPFYLNNGVYVAENDTDEESV